MTALAVVLAAGGGTRFRGATHKLLAPFRGRRVVDWSIDAAVASGLPTVVVSGAVDLGLDRDDVDVRHNPRWAEGQATSVQLAVDAARDGGHDAVVVGLGDQPLVEAEAWRRVAAGAAPLSVATYGGRRGNPVRLAAEVWPLLPTAGDEGARAVVRGRPDLVAGIACPGDPVDIDTVGDLDRWT